MKYKKYISTAFLALLLVPLLSSKSTETTVNPIVFDINDIVFIEEDTSIDLDFDTAIYLPEDFDPYEYLIPIETINFMEEEAEIDLGFDTKMYLPKDFDAYKK